MSIYTHAYKFASAGIWWRCGCVCFRRDQLEETLNGAKVCILTPLIGALWGGGFLLLSRWHRGNEQRDGKPNRIKVGRTLVCGTNRFSGIEGFAWWPGTGLQRFEKPCFVRNQGGFLHLPG
jgi:hypothetical protein